MITNEEIAMAFQSLEKTPDKLEWKTTTSKLFKANVIQKTCSNGSKLKWVELGSAQGHSASTFSSIAKEILCTDIDRKNCDIINSLNLPNVTTMQVDLYDEEFAGFMKDAFFDVAFIDAVHDKAHADKDIANCMNAGVKLYIFDDYGAFSGVKDAVDSFCENLSRDEKDIRVDFIGMPPGSYFPNTQFKTLRDWEGVIVEIL